MTEHRPDVEQARILDAHEVVMQFVCAVNETDIEKMTALMHPEHLFVDTLGVHIEGRMATREAWQGYFNIVPDYRIAVSEVVAGESTIVLVGTSGGTYSPKGCRVPGNRWSAPAAWRARVDGGRIREWQVFADNEPLRERMRRQAEDSD